jgi:hypothetical protein
LIENLLVLELLLISLGFRFSEAEAEAEAEEAEAKDDNSDLTTTKDFRRVMPLRARRLEFMV